MSVKRFYRVLGAVLAASFLTSPWAEAARRNPPPPDGALKPSEVVWGLEKSALSVSIEAAQDLNYAYGSSLGLTLCLYQLSDMAKFQTLAASPEGVATLVGGDLAALEGSGLMSQVIRLQPGEKLSRVWDRMEKAKYFAVAAGYAHQDPSRCSAWGAFPVEKTTVKLRKRKTADYYTAGSLAVKITLSAEAAAISNQQAAETSSR